MKKSLISAFALGLSVNAVASLAPHVPGEIIVKLRSGEDKSVFSTFKSQGIELSRTIDVEVGTFHVVRADQAKSLTNLIDQLNQDPAVEYAEPNYIYELIKPVQSVDVNSLINPPVDYSASNYTPNDPRFGELWGLKNTGSNEPGGRTPGVLGADIDALRAWDITTGSRNVTVAVIDTGIDYNHPDLQENMWVNVAERDGVAGVDDDGNGYVDDIYGYNFAVGNGNPMDGNGHGTHCAGTIGAIHNNGVGVAGVMDNVTFVAVKFLSDSGSGSTENAIKAVDYATKLNVDIMSNSWGGGGYSQALKEAIERASEKGILFTAAAGNSSSNNDQRASYPANYEVPNVISVAATTAQNTLASFSSYGRNTVHIAAPGHNILSTVQRNGYSVFSGTSMATPHVSGALGLLVAAEGRLPVADVKERLIGTSVPVSALKGKTVNAGLLNAYNLLTDFRPERTEPKPDQWQVVSMDEAWETAHPYADNYTETRTYTAPGAKYMRLKIAKYDTEKNYDFIEVANGRGEISEKVSGSGENYVTEYIEGDTLTVTFRTDRSQTRWGFVVEEYEVQY
jgi:thermitase